MSRQILLRGMTDPSVLELAARGEVPVASAFDGTFEVLATAAGGIARLRRFVVDLAIRGRLSEGPPADGKLAEIPDPRVATDQHAPFPVPDGWAWTTLGNLAHLINGDRSKNYPSKIHQVKAGVPFINAGHLVKGAIDTREMNYITEERFDLLRGGKIQKGDILYCLRGSLGKAALVGGIGQGAIASSLMIIRLDEHACSARYLLYYLDSSLGQALIRRYDNGTAQPNLSAADVAKYVVPLPPLAEQKRIVAKVDQLMALCDDLDAKQAKQRETGERLTKASLEALTSADGPEEFAASWKRVADNFDLVVKRPEDVGVLRRAVLELAVRGRMAGSAPEDEPAKKLLERVSKATGPGLCADVSEPPYELPTGWCWARFLEVAAIESHLVDPSPHGKLPHVAPDNIEKGTGRLLAYRTIGEDGVTSGKHLFFPGQILYSKIRPNLSKAVVVDFEGLCSADMYPVRARIDTRYLHLFMLSGPFLAQVVKEDNRLAMPKVNQQQLGDTLVAVPPFPEQKRIVAKVDQLMALCDDLEAKLRRAEEGAAKLAEAVVASMVA